MAFMLNKGGFCSAAISKRKAIVQFNDNNTEFMKSHHCINITSTHSYGYCSKPAQVMAEKSPKTKVFNAA